MAEFQAFLDLIHDKYNDIDYKRIVEALDFATKAHEKQFRDSGEKFIIHPVAVALTIVDLGMDADSVIAALLHDTLEDTDVTDKNIYDIFGPQILNMVRALTKLRRLTFTSQEEEQAEYMRKLFVATADDDHRILVIKLADRLHNMQTLSFLSGDDKKLKKARETLDIYAPLAGRLGISKIKSELEDLSMKYVFPKDYDYLAEIMQEKRGERMKYVDIIVNRIRDIIKESDIQGEVLGRPKHLYSIYKKMKSGKKIEEIYDIIAVRVIVDSVKDCYAVLGEIHARMKPIPGRIKDYIAVPKLNMYQSLHTTVITEENETIEIQIRTVVMNRVAEYGIAAHWMYKEGEFKNNEPQNRMSRNMHWFGKDMGKDLGDPGDFIEALKENITSHEIYVFTPKGELINLPKGANSIDFAYKVHSGVGNRCSGAKIGGVIVPLVRPLNNGEVVEILTANSKGPSRDWLKKAKTANARAKIKSYFKKEYRTENIKIGKEMLEADAKRRGYNFSDLLRPEWLKPIFQRLSVSELDDMFAMVGYAGVKTSQILVNLISLYRKEKEQLDIANKATNLLEKKSSKPVSGIIIEGYDSFALKLSRCCNPVPGDSIIGYIVKGKGVSVHRKNCVNIKNVDKERLLEAKWASVENSLFMSVLRISCMDKSGMIGKISSLVGNLHMNIVSMEAKVFKKGELAEIKLVIEVKSLSDLDLLVVKLNGVDGVYNIVRSN